MIDFQFSVFESIDCGGSGSYTDENIIVWTGDDEFMQNIGETKVVQSGNAVSDPVMSTLRVFSSTRKKNCYSIDVDKGVQVLVRASFYYGNYDKKSAPPSFDLHFNGNYWATVETSSEGVVYYEATYIVKDNGVSVCVAQTKPNQFPFMSALEVRSLDSHMYNHVDAEYALFLKSRTTYGAKDIVRFANDPYDRIWVPGAVGDGSTTVTNTAIAIDVSVPDNPPQAAFQNAITTSSTSQHIVLGNGLFPAKPVPIYVNMYFSEVSELDPSTQTRSFQVSVNDVPASQQAIVPQYGSVTELYIGNITASSNTSFTLAADSNSKLPPLINAMEVFYVSDPMTDGTNSKDVEGLASLQSQFDVLKEWGGDPCLPSPYTWDWVNCSTDATPRVTALDLNDNSLSESLPDFLGTLPSLKQLNLADNEFSGPIPTSLSNNKKLKLVVSGNPNLCVSGKSCETTTGSSTDTQSGSGTKKSSKLPAILGGTIPSFIVFWAIVGTVAVLHHRRKTAAISALHTGQGGGGGNRPNGTANANRMGKIGQAVINGIKVNIEEQINS
ncbi:hypothetical protein LWI28_008694 [Acer negundo]|uniref:Malectin-like domain-containing protein n=1 Tax=Acer negundo TaxID=4023 RepID=A0AAD5P2I9_ACENE|nr:hypothetical protein LWI28_008694 [Acer negundo]